jgi:hypothetical protein
MEVVEVVDVVFGACNYKRQDTVLCMIASIDRCRR